jgi:hypothetical protein
MQVTGTPDDCLQQIQALQTLTGVGHLVTEFSFGGMCHWEGEVNMRLFAESVMPKLQRATQRLPADRARAAAERARPVSKSSPRSTPAPPRSCAVVAFARRGRAPLRQTVAVAPRRPPGEGQALSRMAGNYRGALWATNVYVPQYGRLAHPGRSSRQVQIRDRKPTSLAVRRLRPPASGDREQCGGKTPAA